MLFEKKILPVMMKRTTAKQRYVKTKPKTIDGVIEGGKDCLGTY